MIDELIKGLEAFKKERKKVVADVMREHNNEIIELVREQLMQGIGANGLYIRPYYTEDPYFRTRKAALDYAAYKKKITPPTVRYWDAPNLFINGKFHSELKVTTTDESLTIEGATNYAKEIVAKYKISTFGLTNENLELIYEIYVVPALIKKLKQYIYGN